MCGECSGSEGFFFKDKSCLGSLPQQRRVFSRRQWGGVRVQHGKRGVLPQAAPDLPVPAAAHRGLRDVLRRHDVLRDAQAAQEDRGHGSEVPAAPGVSVGAAPR